MFFSFSKMGMIIPTLLSVVKWDDVCQQAKYKYAVSFGSIIINNVIISRRVAS